jgi:hypothetical protein
MPELLPLLSPELLIAAGTAILAFAGLLFRSALLLLATLIVFLLALAIFNTFYPRVAPTPAPGQLAAAALSLPASPTLAAALPATNPAPPSPSPLPADRYVVVGNTGGIGVYLRRTPRIADKVKAWPDGTTLLIVGQDGSSEGRVWKHVRDPDGNIGWVPAEYVLPEQPIERHASAPPTAVAPPIPPTAPAQPAAPTRTAPSGQATNSRAPSAPLPPAPTPPKLQPMVAANGQRCWSGPDWEAPAAIAVPECVALIFPGNTATTVRLVWSAEQIRTADLAGQGVALWTDYAQGQTLTARYPDGQTCSGRSIGLTMPGEYLLTVRPSGPSPVRVAQGEVRGQGPDCPPVPPASSPAAGWRLIQSSGGVPAQGQSSLAFTLAPNQLAAVTGGPLAFRSYHFPGGVERGTVILFVGGNQSTQLSLTGLLPKANWLGIFQADVPTKAWPSLLEDRISAMKQPPNCTNGTGCRLVDVLVIDATTNAALAGPLVR